MPACRGVRCVTQTVASRRYPANTPYLSYWFHRSGFADVLPALLSSTVYVGPTYVLDDESAVVVDDGDVRVASEGEWHLR